MFIMVPAQNIGIMAKQRNTIHKAKPTMVAGKTLGIPRCSQNRDNRWRLSQLSTYQIERLAGRLFEEIIMKKLC